MHSRIMGITTKEYYEERKQEMGEELKLPDFETMDQLPGWADYVDPDTNFQEDFEWFCDCLESKYFHYNVKTHTIKFDKGFAEEYFKERFEKLKKMVNANDGLKQFSNYPTSHTMEGLIVGKGGFIVSDDMGWYDNLDNFIRRIEYGVEYIVFDSVDYHW